MISYAYLLVNLCSIAIPVAFSFEHRVQFAAKWRSWLPALIVPAIPFLAWDVFFTSQGFWGFNERYLIGINIFNLPLEEILFFFCIPYCCLFSYEVLNYFVKQDVLGIRARHVTTILAYMLVAVAFQYSDRAYTFITSVLLLVFLLVHLTWKKPYWSRLVFSYVVILVPFFIVNGILTGTGLDEPIVWYNEAEIIGIRLGTIPLEDIFYGFLLIASNITVYERLKP